MTLLGFVYFLFPDLREFLKDLYFVPVVISAMMLGWEKSSAFTVVGVSLVLCVTCASWADQSPAEFLKLLIWGCTLGTTSAVIGLIVFTKDRHVLQLLRKQNSLAMTDQLTQIANRRAFDNALQKRIAEFKRYERSFCILMVDIDYFKKINDSYGHNVGDTVLQMIARAIQCSLRDSDLVARFGGEEFAVLLPATSIEDAKMVAERIRSEVDHIEEKESNCPENVSVSIGIAEICEGDTQATILERADLAMYQAKRKGRNRVSFKANHEVISAEQSPEESKNDLVKSVYHEGQALKQTVDSVTGLTYVEIFENELTRRMYETVRYETKICIGLIQLKKNGEIEATKADIRAQVASIGRVIDKSLRTSDLVTWFSEYEFGIMLPFTGLEDATRVMQRLFWDINTEVYQSGLNSLLNVDTMRVVKIEGCDTKAQAIACLRNSTPVEISESTISW